jgi:hypothetical protein
VNEKYNSSVFCFEITSSPFVLGGNSGRDRGLYIFGEIDRFHIVLDGSRPQDATARTMDDTWLYSAVV